MGVYKEIRKHFGTSVQNYIIAARTTQGFQEWNVSSREERMTVINQWRIAQTSVQKQTHLRQYSQKSFRRSPTTHDPHHDNAVQRKELHDQASQYQPSTKASSRLSLADSITHPSKRVSEDNSSQFEEAIKQSVAETSCGNDAEVCLFPASLRFTF